MMRLYFRTFLLDLSSITYMNIIKQHRIEYKYFINIFFVYYVKKNCTSFRAKFFGILPRKNQYVSLFNGYFIIFI